MAKNATEEYEKTYNNIIRFYDFAEELINTVHDKKVENPEAQLAFIEPLVRQVEEATDILAEEYRNFVRTGKQPDKTSKKNIEESLAKIYSTISLCKEISGKEE